MSEEMDCWPLTLAGTPLFVLEIRGKTDHLNINNKISNIYQDFKIYFVV